MGFEGSFLLGRLVAGGMLGSVGVAIAIAKCVDLGGVFRGVVWIAWTCNCGFAGAGACRAWAVVVRD